MPKLKDIWKTTEESVGGFADIEPGAYVLAVTRVEPHESQEYMRLYWDVAEGPRKGAYARSQWPPSDVASWKESAYGVLKHKFHVLADSNPGFKPSVAFEADDWQAFVGKRFGAVVRRRLYTAGPNSKAPGADRTQMEVALWLTPEQVAAHDYSDALLADHDQRGQGAAQQAAQPVLAQPPLAQPPVGVISVYDEDVPF